MTDHFNLTVTVAGRSAEFSLHDEHGSQIAYRQTHFQTISISHQRGLFDLRNYVRHYVEEGKEAAAVAEVGVCIAKEVLGQEIFDKLWQAQTQRTLRIQLPGAAEEGNILAAALARVPWEIARPGANLQTLAERNLVIRVEHDAPAPASQPLQLGPDEALRVLFVFAEARGSNPLGARKERHELLQLFEKEIYPNRRVVAHFLTHGVTRERLQAQIQENGGYHVVHWSGHGNMNLLELCRPGGESDRLSGQELLDLFTKEAGGFLPRLFFLSACHSGDILSVKNWNDFLAFAQDKKTGTKEVKDQDINLEQQPGYTGTAHALLQGGVPTVIAMRYAVGDVYARELTQEFYRALLAHAQPKNAAVALTQARHALLDKTKHNQSRFAICDHATPLLYGAEQLGLALINGRSTESNPRDPRLHRINELSMAGHAHFVGRTWELVELGADFIGSTQGAEAKPMALITGLGGMGKTALTTEALALWQLRFEWVLLYQAKPNALPFDATLRDIHMKLNAELGRYHKHVNTRPADAIYRDASAEFTGPERVERLTRNLVRALKDEAVLLVLDNFESNLKQHSDAMDSDGYCQDPAWDCCLSALANELAGSPSRVLITCRRPIAALAGAAHHVQLGPLSSSEAALYLREHPALGSMVFGSDDGEKALALRLLNASRFHPLLMDRLARLAADAKLRPQLVQALDTLENSKDFAQLPELFTVTPGDTRELAYLDDALATSLDQLIRNASPDARRLLWIIATANESIPVALLKSMWSEESREQQVLRQVKRDLDRFHELSQERQELLSEMPSWMRERLQTISPSPTLRPAIEPLLQQLVSVGLVNEERNGDEHASLSFACHELVRERIHSWMSLHAKDRGDLTQNIIRLGYAEGLLEAFEKLRHESMSSALRAGSSALVYCVQAESWEHMGSFVGQLVTTLQEPRQLDELIPHLREAADTAPEGPPRWRCLCYLADALDQARYHNDSFPFYEQAATQARSVAKTGGDDSQQAWAILGTISQNWAVALENISEYKAAYERFLEAIEAYKSAKSPDIQVISCELEIIRIGIKQGKAKLALSDVKPRLTQIESWWQQYRSGQLPRSVRIDSSLLARALIQALEISADAHFSLEEWGSALQRLDSLIEVHQHLGLQGDHVAYSRLSRANTLTRLCRYPEAQAELEDCLKIFQGNPVGQAKVRNALAALFDELNDVAQAITQARRALALFEAFDTPSDRAVSHGNLAHYLQRNNTSDDCIEGRRHQLAALIYIHVSGLFQQLDTSVYNYGKSFLDARTTGIEYDIPRINELLADPAFAPLKNWLLQREVDLNNLQAFVDQFLGQIKREALKQD